MPIKGTFSRGNGGTAVNLEFGNHRGLLLDVEDCQVAVWVNNVKTDAYTAGLAFKFKVGDETVLKEVSRSIAPNSNLMKFLTGMVPGGVNPSTMDDAQISAAINGLIGKTFILQVGPSQSGKPKISGIMAMPASSKKGAAQAAPAVAQNDDDDDIPF